MKELPVIGISSNFKEGVSCVSNAYVNAVILAGGCPVLLPVTNNEDSLVNILSKLDGLIFSGGGDIHPSFLNEDPHPSLDSVCMERDLFDLTLIRLASDRQIPILGICRGHQMLNVAFGGTLYQDITTYYPESIEHNQSESRETGTHWVEIKEHSLLKKIFNKKEILTNSFHHQAVRKPAPGFIISASTADGIIEAIESAQCKSIMGVQWHPETMAAAGNQEMIGLLRYFVGEASLYKKAKTLHQRIIAIDSHCDTPMLFNQDINIGKRDPRLKIDIPKMEEGMLDGCIMAAYLPQGKRDEQSTKEAFSEAKKILEGIGMQIDDNKDLIRQARTVSDASAAKLHEKKFIFKAIENGYALGNDLRNLELLKQEEGIVYVTLCHNGHNDLCDSASEVPEFNGLSSLGRKFVKEMNRLGIAIDISHASEKTAFDVLELSSRPIIASHSSVKALCNHSRNLSDKLMKAIAKKGGVVHICAYGPFLSKEAEANLDDLIAHIDYAVRLIGIDHVGIGTDFDGGGGIPGFNSANECINLTIALLRKGYSETDIKHIWGGNLLRVLKQIQEN